MIDVSPRQLEIIKKILLKCVPECEVRVFGSRATWTAKDYSDLDLVVVGKEKLPDKIFYSIKEDFKESELPFRVDVLDWHRISSGFKTNIEKQYEIIQKSPKGEQTKSKESQVGRIPEGWEVKDIGDLCLFSQGTQVSIENQSSVQVNGYERFLRIVDYLGYDKENRYVKLDNSEIVNEDDVVMVRYGSTFGYVGRGLKGIIANNLFKITPKDKTDNAMKSV